MNGIYSPSDDGVTVLSLLHVLHVKYLNSLAILTMSCAVSARGSPLLSGTETNTEM